MGNRYWVGGTANWDATAGSKWATTSGGAGGAAVPTAVDDVFFDAASGAVTITGQTATPVCLNFNCTGFTGTFALSGVNFVPKGSITFSSTMTFTPNGYSVVLDATSGTLTITSAGKQFYALIVGNSANTGSITLQDALVCANTLTVTGGTFTTNNFNVTASSLSSNNSNTRTINLGSSTVTFSANSNPIVLTTTTGLTFNAGTSSIVCTGLGNNFDGGGQTFYNVSWTGTATGTKGVVGANTFNNFAVTGPASAGVILFTFSARQTINGTLSTTGTAGNRRVWFQGLTYGLAQTLTINSAPSLTDADFRDIYVIGTAAPISGTRIGDLRGCSGITFSAAKTVYWNLAGAQNWSATGWATTSAGTPSDDNFPLAQDTATFTNAGSVTGTITMNSAIPYTGTVDMSGRTSAMTLSTTAFAIYGDWKNGSGTTLTSTADLTYSGRNTQTITSASKTFVQNIVCDSYGGTVQLADALSMGSQIITVTNGTFDTKNYNVTAGVLSSSNVNVRAITLGSSTVTLSSTSPLSFAIVNLTFNCGTSSIVCTSAGISFTGAFQTFYDVSFTGGAGVKSLSSVATYRNLSVTAPSSAAITELVLSADQTITGTLTVAGATAVRRIFVRSSVLGTTRTLTVGTLSATDCDFRDITMAGAAAGSSPTRAGDCGGNTSITFPAAKTVYWNLAGAQNWSATGWCPSSGGTPDINQFPLAQDTAVFDNTGSVTGAITINAAWNIGGLDSSTRSSAMTLTASATCTVYGSITTGSGITYALTTVIFSGRGTQTLTTNGKTFTQITVNSSTGTLQLGDALTIASNVILTLTSGTFDAVSYNVTAGFISITGSTSRTLKMGSGTWTISGTSTSWDATATTNLNFYKSTANIVLSDTSTSARSFAGGSLSYNKLTIGGATGTSTTTISGNNQFTELASTKTVAHTIDFGATTQTFGAWTVTGTVGNVVTVSGTATLTIAGARVSGVDYLALGTTVISATSPGEFYAGANSTGGTNAILTAAPTAVTRYWRGGTGTWDATTTTNWSTTSGGVSGASVPTSADAVIFDSLSNATAYTVTCTATQLRCAALTFAGPATGNVTWAGTAPLAIHGNTSLAATGITRSYTGTITLTGSSTGRTLTTNGVTLASATTVNGVGCGWTLGSALDIGSSNLTVTNGSFDTSNYSVTCQQLNSNNTNTRSVTLGSSTVSVADTLSFTDPTNLTFSSGTSQINLSGTASTLNSGGQTFYNVSYTTTSATAAVILTGGAIFNNLTKSGVTAAGISSFEIRANQTINGTLTLSAGTNATMRTFVQSNTIGTTRTLTCAAFAGTDADFRDITIAGAAAPVSGTRLGDAKGNSGITFDAAKTVYWRAAASANWASGSINWSLTDGGTGDVNYFPLPQDTCVFATFPNSGNSSTINAAYNIGTIDMSARTSNTMTLAIGSTTPAIYGNWINGTGTTLSGTGTLTFAGRGSQTITSAGRTFTQIFSVNTPSGSVTLQDAFASNAASASGAIQFSSGTFSDAGYNLSLTSTSAGAGINIGGTSNLKTLTVNGSCSIAASSGCFSTAGATVGSITVTGTGTISLTSASAKTFAGGGISYSGITLDQGGAGTLTITGNNTFKNITNSYSATGATTIAMGTTTQTVTQFTGTGTVGKVLTIQGTSASSPGTLILTTGTVTTPDYLAITGIRAYNLASTWYAGANSTNNGSLGWIFSAGVIPPVLSNGNFFFVFG